MPRRLLRAVAMSCVATLAIPYPVQSKGPAPGEGPAFELTDPDRIKVGKERFDSTCAAFCHGHEPALFIGRTDLDAQYVYDTIHNGGGGATPMPPWGDVFTPEEIWELVAYVRSLGKNP